uniref:Uncharacterized protein n=1 Tax=Homalodisca liturata TaxID=320908 RepID=A0A1B6IQC3_9HEMI
MKIFLVPMAVCTALHFVNAAILIPEELPTITGILYSILPPIKIGQDSRVGFGFRIGPNADAQVLVELGPQTNTTPLGANSEKRQTKGPAERVRQRDKLFKQWLQMMRNRLNNAISSNVVTTYNNETKYD